MKIDRKDELLLLIAVSGNTVRLGWPCSRFRILCRCAFDPIEAGGRS